MLLDYETLRVIWWVLMGVLLIGFAATDGFDMGVGVLLPWLGRTDTERRIIINTVGPVWEGNQVWFVLGGGAIFAAWPPLYAVSFSGFYLAMFVVLFALILRPVSFKYRSKREDPRWRSTWDWGLFTGSAVPALIFGVAVGNVLQGVPFHLTEELRPVYTGGFFGLLNPFALLCGLVSVSMLVTHGAVWLTLKTDGAIAERARGVGSVCALLGAVLFVFAGFALWRFIDGYAITSAIDTTGPSNPLLKDVAVAPGGWFFNYSLMPWTRSAPILGIAGAVIAFLCLRLRWPGLAFAGSLAGIFGTISTVGLAMFPFILPSSSDPRSSLTAWDSSSSQLTLMIMLGVTAVFLPIVLAYTAWAFRVMWGRVSAADIERDASSAY